MRFPPSVRLIKDVDTLLEACDLVKRYGPVNALDGFSLRVAAGEIVGLVGHNGAGKTTFVEIVSSLIRPDSGTVTIDGKSPSAARGQVGVTPQHLGLYPSITVREHLQLFGRLAGLRRTALTAAIDDLAVALRLTEIMGRKTGVLSGGQQRRTQAATALIHRPPLLLLDEPTAGLDPESADGFCDLLRGLHRELGLTVVMITHDLDTLFDLSSRIAVLADQKVIVSGTTRDVIAYPHPFIHEYFLGGRGQRAMEALHEGAASRPASLSER